MKTQLVYNPSAGMRSELGEIQRAMHVLHQCGWHTEIAETVRQGDATRLAYHAAQQNYDAVLAVGGDGTVNEIANGLVDSNTALGVLPLGTVNVWAREMGLPLGDLAGAAQGLADATVCAIDVGEVRMQQGPPRIFILYAGIGLDAAITQIVEPQREMKRRLAVCRREIAKRVLPDPVWPNFSDNLGLNKHSFVVQARGYCADV